MRNKIIVLNAKEAPKEQIKYGEELIEKAIRKNNLYCSSITEDINICSRVSFEVFENINSYHKGFKNLKKDLRYIYSLLEECGRGASNLVPGDNAYYDIRIYGYEDSIY